MERAKALVFVVTGVALLVGAATSGLSIRRFIRESAVTDGRVVRLNAGGSHPQIAFSANSETISYPQGGLITGYKVGDVVRVRYLPSDPRGSATLDQFGALFFWPLLLAILGGGFGIAGAAMLLAKRG